MAQITDLYIYPVKSLKGIALKEAQTAKRGLQFDREWMVTDHQYNFISQREIELMTTIQTGIDSHSLILTSSNQKFLKFHWIHQEVIKLEQWFGMISVMLLMKVMMHLDGLLMFLELTMEVSSGLSDLTKG